MNIHFIQINGRCTDNAWSSKTIRTTSFQENYGTSSCNLKQPIKYLFSIWVLLSVSHRRTKDIVVLLVLFWKWNITCSNLNLNENVDWNKKCPIIDLSYLNAHNKICRRFLCNCYILQISAFCPNGFLLNPYIISKQYLQSFLRAVNWKGIYFAKYVYC